MFEEYDMEYFLDKLRDKVPTDVSSEEGSVIYAALVPLAYELERLYIELDQIYKQTFPETADYKYLEMRAKERGIAPVEATSCKAQGEFDAAVPEGTRFACGNYVYVSGEALNEAQHIYVLQCTTEGTEPNATLGTLTPIDYVEGLSTGNLTKILKAGKNKEDEETFRSRYLASFSDNAFGGNILDYREKVNAIDGVGGVHVYPIWNGAGTVKLEIISDDYLKASESLIKKVQEVICPSAGTGYGLAPIGHDVTVVSAEELPIKVETTLTLQSGFTSDDVKDQVKAVISAYLAELREKWENTYHNQKATLIVRIAEIESRVLSIAGILDVTDTTVNGSAKSVSLRDNEIPVLSEVIC